MFRFYLEVVRTMYRRQLVYRWANLAGLATNIFFACVFSYVLIALFQARSSVSGFDMLDSLRYTWLVQALIMVVLPFGQLDLLMTIRTGEVVSDLSKPCDFYWYWFSRECGRNYYYFLFRCIPTYAAGVLLFGLGIPTSWSAWLGFAVVLVLGSMLGIAYRFMFNVLAFWVVEGRAAVTLAHTIALFFTGSFIPIPFLPAWLRSIAEWLPFNGLMNLPSQVLLGKISGGAFWFELGRQAGWMVVFTCICLWLTRMATRRVISQGG